MKKNAILFSAGNYINSPILSVPSLSGVKYDIQAINKRLTQIGFDVNQIEDVSKAQFIPALENNASNSPSDAIHIVYFSGHGGHTNGNNYIYPIDFSPLLNNSRNLEASAVDISDIISIYEGKGRLPEFGKELCVTFDVTKCDNHITINTNLPDNYILLVKSNLSKFSEQMSVKNGSVIINDANNISKITLGSAFITDPTVSKQLGGEKAKNLIGKFVKYNPITGRKQIDAVFSF